MRHYLIPTQACVRGVAKDMTKELLMKLLNADKQTGLAFKDGNPSAFAGVQVQWCNKGSGQDRILVKIHFAEDPKTLPVLHPNP